MMLEYLIRNKSRFQEARSLPAMKQKFSLYEDFVILSVFKVN